MWRQLLEYGRQLVSLTRDTQQNQAEIKEIHSELRELRSEVNGLRREFNDLVRIVQAVTAESVRIRENEAHEREKLMLRLENTLLKFERRLPPPREAADSE